MDGGKVRVREPKGDDSHWLDYKAVSLHGSFYAAYFLKNEVLIDYVNRQALNSLVTCLGDGYDGIWNQIRKFNPDGNRREILDWYHLVGNLYKVAWSRKRLSKAKELLWQGRIDETLKLFELCSSRQTTNFCKYFTKHRNRIVNSQLLSSQNICSIGSEAVELLVKQIDRRLKIVGAQWCRKNINHMLKLRCAYLNELI